MSNVVFHVLNVICKKNNYLFFIGIFSEKVVKLIGRGSVINRATPSSFKDWFKI